MSWLYTGDSEAYHFCGIELTSHRAATEPAIKVSTCDADMSALMEGIWLCAREILWGWRAVCGLFWPVSGVVLALFFQMCLLVVAEGRQYDPGGKFFSD